MKKIFFSHAFLKGFASIGKGMTLLSLFPLKISSERFLSYAEQFGTDVEIIASDWQKVGDDLRVAVEGFENEKQIFLKSV